MQKLTGLPQAVIVNIAVPDGILVLRTKDLFGSVLSQNVISPAIRDVS